MSTPCETTSDTADRVQLRCGRASAAVCPCCSSLALEIGNVAVRMKCRHFSEFHAALQLLAARMTPTQERAALALAGTSVTLQLSRHDLEQLDRLGHDLMTDETFQMCCGSAPTNRSASAVPPIVN